jgi:hypothetical protein
MEVVHYSPLFKEMKEVFYKKFQLSSQKSMAEEVSQLTDLQDLEKKREGITSLK